MKKNIQTLFILLIVNMNLAMSQNQSLCTISDVYISEQGQFFLSTVANNDNENKISIIYSQKDGIFDTLDVIFEEVSMLEGLQFIELDNFLFLPILTQTLQNSNGFYELFCLKLSVQNNNVQLLSKTKLLDKLKGNISSFSAQNVRNNIQINFCYSAMKSRNNTSLTLDKELTILDEHHHIIEGDMKSLKILNDDYSTFFVSNNSIFNLNGKISNDAKWNYSNNILASKIHFGNLMVVVSGQSTTRLLSISKDCKIINERILVFSESFRSHIIKIDENFDIVLNLKSFGDSDFSNMQFKVNPNTLQVLDETIINIEENLPFFRYKFNLNQEEFYIYDEVFLENEKGVGVKIIENSENKNEEKFNLSNELLISSFLLFPNPTKSFVQISFSENILDKPRQIQIYDSRGIEMFNKQTYNSNLFVDISAWRQGLYKVGITIDGQTTFQSLVVAR